MNGVIFPDFINAILFMFAVESSPAEIIINSFGGKLKGEKRRSVNAALSSHYTYPG